EGWRATHPIGGHRGGNRAVPGTIDTDRKRNPILVQECAEGLGSHHTVMLENGVKPDDAHVPRVEGGVDASSLRKTVGHTPGAEHLEGVENHHPSSKLGELEGEGVE